MDKTILQYEISDWHQLKDCQSNNSPILKIKVCDFIQNPDILGTKIEVCHQLYGTLFAYTIQPKGNLISYCDLDLDQQYIMNRYTLLNELKRYGFYVDYVEESYLESGLVELLRTIQGLKFDKIRIISVHENADKYDLTNYICAFNILENPNWVNAGYSPSKTEWENSLINGSALNVSGLEYANKFNWSWLYNSVIDLDVILSRYEEDDNE